MNNDVLTYAEYQKRLKELKTPEDIALFAQELIASALAGNMTPEKKEDKLDDRKDEAPEESHKKRILLPKEKLISERDALMMKLNIQHDVSAKIDLFKETCYKFLSKINDPKIVTERLKKDTIKLVIDEVAIKCWSIKIFTTIPLPTQDSRTVNGQN